MNINFNLTYSIPMKNTSFLKIIAPSLTAILMAAPAYGAPSPDNRDFPQSYSGTMLPYDFSRTDNVVPWNPEMRPVYINYVARHGARFLSSEKKIDKMRRVLEEARKEGQLSKKGEAFLRLIERVDSATDGRWGALNRVGIAEEKRLAREMTEIAPQLLEKGKIKAIATYVPRVVLTMYEFCHELACISSQLEISTSEGHQFDPLLRYFTTDSAYVSFLSNPDWKNNYKAYAGRMLPTSPAASMFTIGKENKELQKLSLDAYGILQSLDAAGLSADIGEWFDPLEYRHCWEVSNLEHYYERSASRFSDIPTNSAKPLLKSIIASTDAHLQGRTDEVAFLRFGHAETLLPLFALMRLPGAYAPEADPDDLARVWNDSDISPLGANLMIVVLKNEDGENFVAMRLNGKWVKTDGKEVVGWGALKDLWISYLNN